ncbi:MAG: hypothetical protein LIP06_12595 [Tannerellaceae bacterium]|nr:hypothetical protein [Tannerellaceae bacterium]
MSNKIKILYALESAGGGCLKHVIDLSTYLPAYKFDIRIVIPDEEYEEGTKKAQKNFR